MQGPQEEIKRFCGNSEVREIEDTVDKAIWFLENYSGEVEISNNALCKYFKIDHKTLQKRMWSHLLGYKGKEHSKSRYLSPFHEQVLAEKIDVENKKWNTVAVVLMTCNIKGHCRLAEINSGIPDQWEFSCFSTHFTLQKLLVQLNIFTFEV